MKSLKFICCSTVFVLLLSWIVLSCKKNETPDPSQSSDPIKTEVGTPTGDAATASIGSSGGTLTSLDGNLTVTIPAGALSGTTTISIQPITNTAPLGVGDGYQLLPEGTMFNKPVQLIFHYDTTLLNGSSPYLLWFATQTSDGSWDAMLDSHVDTTLSTVTVESTHFSNWVIGNCLEIDLNPQKTHVKLNESLVFKISSFVLPQTNTSGHTKLIPSNGSGGTDILTPNDIKILNWNSLTWIYNGKNAPYIDERGSLIPSGKTATYKAPSEMPKNNFATVNVPLEVSIKKLNKTLNPTLSSVIIIGDYGVKIKIDGATVATYPIGACGISNNSLAISVIDTLTEGVFTFFNVTAGAHKIGTACAGKKNLIYYWPNFAEQSQYFGLEYDIRKKTTDGCSLIHQCSNGTLFLDPFTKEVGKYISGWFHAYAYYDDFAHVDCGTPTPTGRYLEVEFYLPIQVVSK